MNAVSGIRRAMRERVDGTLVVQIEIDPPHRAEFLALFPEIDMPVALAPLNANFEQEAPRSGHWVAALYKSGWWFNPDVLKALGSDKEFREWVQRQPSCLSGRFSEYVDGVGYCEAAHVRRAGESGTAYKAPYACIPLTHDEHDLQHHDGETALGKPQAWFDEQRAKYVAEWAHSALRGHLGVDSLRDASPRDLCAWADQRDLLKTLPLALREA